MRQLELPPTELFLEKSLGMHISENNHLNEANVKKGYDRVLGLEGMLLFEGIEALLNIALPFVALWVFTISTGRWAVGTIIMVILATPWPDSFLNQRVLRVCSSDRQDVEVPEPLPGRAMAAWSGSRRTQEEIERKEIERLFDQANQPDRKFWYWFIRQATYRNAISDALLFTLIAYCVLR